MKFVNVGYFLVLFCGTYVLHQWSLFRFSYLGCGTDSTRWAIKNIYFFILKIFYFLFLAFVIPPFLFRTHSPFSLFFSCSLVFSMQTWKLPILCVDWCEVQGWSRSQYSQTSSKFEEGVLTFARPCAVWDVFRKTHMDFPKGYLTLKQKLCFGNMNNWIRYM